MFPATLGLSPVVYPWVLCAVAAVYAIGAIVNLTGPGSIPDDYARWGYPRGFRFVTAGLEAIALALILDPEMRTAGLMLGGAVMAAAIATLIRARAYFHTIPALIVLALSILLTI